MDAHNFVKENLIHTAGDISTQGDLKVLPQMADFFINESKQNELDVCLSNKSNSIAVAEDVKTLRCLYTQVIKTS